MEEKWSPIEGFPGYEVSNLGRVRSWKANNSGGKFDLPHVLSTPPLWSGHRQVRLWRDGKGYPRRVHVLVLEAFVGPRPDPSMDGAHINGDPGDNRLPNLAWKTRLENNMDRVKHGTMPRKLTSEQVVDIRRLRQQGVTFQRLADRFNVSIRCIQLVVMRKTWDHVK